MQGESPRINRRLRPFGRWLPTHRPIRVCEVARAEKARANAPSIWPSREERHRGVVLFISSFFLNFNPSVPPTFSLAYLLLSACSATQRPNREKNFSRSQIRPTLARPTLLFPSISSPHFFSVTKTLRGKRRLRFR